MLSRTAENLFWVSRFMERAELTSRLLEVGYRIALMPNASTGYQNEWASVLSVSGSEVGYKKKYGPPKQEYIEHYLFHDLDKLADRADSTDHPGLGCDEYWLSGNATHGQRKIQNGEPPLAMRLDKTASESHPRSN